MDLVTQGLNVAATRVAAGLALLAAIALPCAAVAQGEPASDRERQLLAQLEQQRLFERREAVVVTQYVACVAERLGGFIEPPLLLAE